MRRRLDLASSLLTQPRVPSLSWPGRCSCPSTTRSSGCTWSGPTAPASSAR